MKSYCSGIDKLKLKLRLKRKLEYIDNSTLFDMFDGNDIINPENDFSLFIKNGEYLNLEDFNDFNDEETFDIFSKIDADFYKKDIHLYRLDKHHHLWIFR